MLEEARAAILKSGPVETIHAAFGVYTGAVSVKLTLPPELDRRLAGLGDAIAAASDDVVFVDLFGSVATGSLRPGSDVDVAIWAAPGSDAHRVRLAVTRACSRQLGTDAIDVVLLNGAHLARGSRAHHPPHPPGS